MVHNQSIQPFTVKSGINIPTGFETYVSVNRNFYNKLDKPYSNCLKDLTPVNGYGKILFGYFKDLNVSYYDQDFCYTLCYQDKLIDECECCDIITPEIRGCTFCASDLKFECMNVFETKFAKADIKAVCESACPQQCYKAKYNLYISTATFPTLSYLKKKIPYFVQGKYSNGTEYESYFFPQDRSDSEIMDFAREGFLKFIVNYENLYYTTVDESPKVTTQGLFADIGGNLGLFIGLSLLSFIELLELVVQLIIIFIEHRKKDNEVVQTISYPYFNHGFVQN